MDYLNQDTELNIQTLNNYEQQRFERNVSLLRYFSDEEHDKNSSFRVSFGKIRKSLKEHWKEQKDWIKNPESIFGQMKMFGYEFLFLHEINSELGYYIERSGAVKGDRTKYTIRFAPTDPRDLNRGD